MVKGWGGHRQGTKFENERKKYLPIKNKKINKTKASKFKIEHQPFKLRQYLEPKLAASI